MKVLKFGGTSVGSAQNIQAVAEILSNQEENCIVVFSAMSGTTNALVEICNVLNHGDIQASLGKVEVLRSHYRETARQLFNEAYSAKASRIIEQEFDHLLKLCNNYADNNVSNEILIRGEIVTSQLIQLFLEKSQIHSTLVNAIDFMRTDKEGQPDYFYIKEKFENVINKQSLIITQGYVCIDSGGNNSNLGRGGSDYTATIIGSVIGATQVEIWTDIDGLHNNDPRIVEETYPISALSYEEAEELAYFGAKILHPTCIHPVSTTNVPVWLKNTFNPSAKGTLIHREVSQRGIKALAVKDNIISICIKSARMMMAYGFLSKIFAVFEKYRCPVDMITTSEIAVSVTIEEGHELENIIEELQALGSVTVAKEQSIICLVGDFRHETRGVISQISQALTDIPLRMISYGASQNNICILIDSEDKTDALQQVNERLFRKTKEFAL